MLMRITAPQFQWQSFSCFVVPHRPMEKMQMSTKRHAAGQAPWIIKNTTSSLTLPHGNSLLGFQRTPSPEIPCQPYIWNASSIQKNHPPVSSYTLGNALLLPDILSPESCHNISHLHGPSIPLLSSPTRITVPSPMFITGLSKLPQQ